MVSEKSNLVPWLIETTKAVLLHKHMTNFSSRLLRFWFLLRLLSSVKCCQRNTRPCILVKGHVKNFWKSGLWKVAYIRSRAFQIYGKAFQTIDQVFEASRSSDVKSLKTLAECLNSCDTTHRVPISHSSEVHVLCRIWGNKIIRK